MFVFTQKHYSSTKQRGYIIEQNRISHVGSEQHTSYLGKMLLSFTYTWNKNTMYKNHIVVLVLRVCLLIEMSV